MIAIPVALGLLIIRGCANTSLARNHFRKLTGQEFDVQKKVIQIGFTGYTRQGQEWPFLVMSLGLFLGIGLWYSLATPPFETPDEVYHYAFVRHVAAGNGLPVQTPAVAEAWLHEGSQAPLYYLLVGWLTAAIDQRDFDQLNLPNPRANIGDPLFPGNKNFMLYSAVTRPLQGANLALHVGRWVSLALGSLTLWLLYGVARLAFADKLACRQPWPFSFALLPVLWVATMPQFAFISAACSNDSLVIAASTATVYWLAHLVSKATDTPIARLEWLWLGLLIGIAALSKLQGLGLLPLVGVATVIIAVQRRDWRIPYHAALPIAVPALLVAGWWYGRNYILYGDLFGVTNLLANNGLRADRLTWSSSWGEFRGFRYSFWGLFGWFNLLLPVWVYALLDGITLTALIGALLAGVGGKRPTDQEMVARSARSVRLLLWSWLFIVVVLLLYWLNQATSSQGRLFFPALSAFAVLLVFGLQVWLRYLPSRVQAAVWLLPPLLLLGCSLYTLTVLFPASYGAPQPVATIPADAQLVEIVYGDTDRIYLRALDIPTQRFRPGERVPITLYLEARTAIQDDYQLFIQLLDEQGEEVANLTTHPGWGRNPTSLWQPGAIYADSYPVLIQRASEGSSPLLARVYIGFVDPKTETRGRLPLPAQTTGGTPIQEGPFVGHVAISPLQPPTVDLAQMTANGAQFGNVIQLSAVDFPTEVKLGSTGPFTITLVWDAIGTPATDYTAFVHLLDADQNRVSGFDQAPALRFPTRYWRTGDRIVSHFVLSPPTTPGEFALWVGLYDAESGGALRLPITSSADRTTGDGQVIVGRVSVK